MGISEERIAFLEKKDNWWGPAGQTGPCGPDTEIFYWKLNSTSPPKRFDPNDKNWVEIWNNVFMQYLKNPSGDFSLAKQKNVDTGMGVERTIAALNGLEDDYLTDCFLPIIKKIEELSGIEYPKNKEQYKRLAITEELGGNLSVNEEVRVIRIIADHIKASVFIIADGITPGNKEQGYVLRRLIRRAIVYGRKIKLEKVGFFTNKIADPVFKIYPDYKELKNGKDKILKILFEEENKFNGTLTKGLEILKETIEDKKDISGKDAFLLYQSYGFPLEMTLEMLNEKNIQVDSEKIKKEFYKEQTKHQNLSRNSTQGKFKSGLADNSSETTKLHTVTHMLNSALKIVLNNTQIHQKGSNITPERLRFDFNFGRKLTNEEIDNIEKLVNKKIKENLEVKREEMYLKDALKSGAESEFGAKYPEKVSVYTIVDPSKKRIFQQRDCYWPPCIKHKRVREI